ncbi:MAG: hypothetical protein CM1200mP18_19710 [Gammaproteobacteria bacterium]|nr:MAG: hypothetical protein CM1200mP18_19710 [Gammaproteobacteria bacterium]
MPEQRNLVMTRVIFWKFVPYISVPGPDHFKFTTNFASIGFGVWDCIRGCRARQQHSRFGCGDGGFLMTIGELETVVREDLPLSL